MTEKSRKFLRQIHMEKQQLFAVDLKTLTKKHRELKEQRKRVLFMDVVLYVDDAIGVRRK